MEVSAGVVLTLAGIAVALYGPLVLDRVLGQPPEEGAAPTPEARALRVVGILVALYGAMSLT